MGLYCNDLGTMRDFYARVLGLTISDEDLAGVKIDRPVTHGIACSVYFYDPEDDRIELYYTTPYKIRQPLGEPIDLDRPDSELLAFAMSFEETTGPPRGAQQPVGR